MQQEIVGIGAYPEERRTYPLGDVASEVAGYAGVDNNGLAGLELALDKTLARRATARRRSSATRSATRST